MSRLMQKFIFIATLFSLQILRVSSTNGHKNCSADQFACHTKTSECIALNWMCDDNPDCSDASDELDCNGGCRVDEFTCTNKHCIQQRWTCDQDDDCGDQSDEKICATRFCKPDEYFACSETHCITLQWQCDGEYDCPDQSDEENCSVNFSRVINCSTSEYPCKDRITCIHKDWQCDGENDCPDGTDELLDMCQNTTCRLDQFQCMDYSCISGHLTCDGKNDCIDGSDEKNCSAALSTCNLSTEFECSHGSCITLEVLCDKKPDCDGWEDEKMGLCNVNECSKNNGECSQLCFDLPIGYRCDCYPGYVLYNNKTCIDINECEIFGSCSHYCTNTNGTYKCNCATGYLKDPQDTTRCKATEGHASLIFTRPHDIRKIALDRKEITELANNTKLATALDFVFRTGMLFWNDAGEQKIFKAPIDEGNDKSVVIDEDLTMSDGIAIDWIYNHIYWTDIRKKTINIADFNGNMKKTLITDSIHEPRALALNPLDGWMFWSDWGDAARIERSGMDGSHRSIIIGVDIKWPNGLTLDLIARRIFWVDAKLHIITSSDYNGLSRRTILFSLETLFHPFSITVFEDFIYWSDWNKKSIFKANKFTGQGIESVISNQSLHRPMVVHIYHPYKQPDGTNQCESINGHCSHLCLPSPKINSQSPLLSCACPDNLILSSDGLSCTETANIRSSESSDVILGAPATSMITGTVLSILLLGVLPAITILTACHKYCLKSNLKSISFYNPVYRKKTEDFFYS